MVRPKEKKNSITSLISEKILNKNLYKIKKYTLLLLSFTSIFGTSLIDLYFPTYNQIIKKLFYGF